MHSKIIRQRLYGKEFQQRLGCVPLSQTTKRTAIEGHIGNLHAALYQVGGIFFCGILRNRIFLFGCKTFQARLSMELLSSSWCHARQIYCCPPTRTSCLDCQSHSNVFSRKGSPYKTALLLRAEDESYLLNVPSDYARSNPNRRENNVCLHEEAQCVRAGLH